MTLAAAVAAPPNDDAPLGKPTTRRAATPCPGVTILAENLADCVVRAREATDSLIAALLAHATAGDIAAKAASVVKSATAAAALAGAIEKAVAEISQRQPLKGLRS
jgi:hypothetical protein